MSKLTLSELAENTLREQIFSGDLAPARAFTEEQLSERLGLSRTPVRAAMERLAAAGLVDVIPRRGMTVRAISARDIKDIYEVLTELEAVAAERAASSDRFSAPRARLHASLGNMRHALTVNDMRGWAAADAEFHRSLVLLSDNARIVQIFDLYTDQVRRARRLTLYKRPLPTASNDDHAAVLEAIEAGDGATARRLHRAHLERARAMLVSLMPEIDPSRY